MANNESILLSVKKLLGITEDEVVFDTDIIIHINSVFMVLNQLGVGPEEPFNIQGVEETWGDFDGSNNNLAGIKTYVYLKVRLIFDPPTIGSLVSSMESQIAEFEWRLNVKSERG